MCVFIKISQKYCIEEKYGSKMFEFQIIIMQDNLNETSQDSAFLTINPPKYLKKWCAF